MTLPPARLIPGRRYALWHPFEVLRCRYYFPHAHHVHRAYCLEMCACVESLSGFVVSPCKFVRTGTRRRAIRAVS